MLSFRQVSRCSNDPSLRFDFQAAKLNDVTQGADTKRFEQLLA